MTRTLALVSARAGALDGAIAFSSKQLIALGTLAARKDMAATGHRVGPTVLPGPAVAALMALAAGGSMAVLIAADGHVVPLS